MKVSVDFCGEIHQVSESRPITLGRDADLVVDDNPFLHRRFLEIAVHDGLCWLSNVGSRLSATVVDEASRVQAWASPGARLPLVFEITHVRFTAGPTTYELTVLIEDGPFAGSPMVAGDDASSVTETIGHIPLTPDQRLLIVALAEPLLRQEGRGTAAIPSSADAARRLGWQVTKFNRKLDNVCDKLDRIGVRGLHGAPGKLASTRRARLVEYAVSVGLVTTDDLASLDV